MLSVGDIEWHADWANLVQRAVLMANDHNRFRQSSLRVEDSA
jgi:hypothetical protein